MNEPRTYADQMVELRKQCARHREEYDLDSLNEARDHMLQGLHRDGLWEWMADPSYVVGFVAGLNTVMALGAADAVLTNYGPMVELADLSTSTVGASVITVDLHDMARLEQELSE